jgi:hypothetical protein
MAQGAGRLANLVFRDLRAVEPPKVSLRLKLFTGLRLASARGALSTAGCWSVVPKTYRFAWHGKRSASRIAIEGMAIKSWPLAGGPDLISAPHQGDVARIAALDLSKQETEAMPDPGLFIGPEQD